MYTHLHTRLMRAGESTDAWTVLGVVRVTERRADNDTATNTVVATVPVGKRPWNMAITPDGKKLYVANGRSNSVSLIDTDSNQVLHEIAVGELPWGVVFR